MTLRIGSLFSGIGGLELGVEAATGGHVVWQVERDPWCRSVLARHWPDATRFDDVCTVGSELAAVDLICGGFPCQPASVAGARKGMSDDRWLWPQFARIVGVVRPRFVLLENVAGLLTLDDGRAWGSVLGSLAALGYDAVWDVFRASDVGAPHRRERVFGLAYATGDLWGSSGDEVRIAPDWRCNGAALAYARGVDAQRRGSAGVVDGASGALEGEVGQRQRGGDAPCGGSEALSMAYAERGESWQRHQPDVQWRRAGEAEQTGVGGGVRSGAARVTEQGKVEPRLGGGVDGLPARLDAHRWPAGRGEVQHEWEPPRISVASPGRRNRLRALGNAVVPQVAALALKTLSARSGVAL